MSILNGGLLTGNVLSGGLLTGYVMSAYNSSVPVTPSYQATNISSIPTNFTYSRADTSTVATYSANNAAVNTLMTAGPNVARYEFRGTTPLYLKKESASTNYCTNNNYSPAVGVTTGLTKGGDAASTLNVVTDSGNLLKTAIYDYGNTIDLSTVCTGGIGKLDNTAGTTPTTVDFSGNPVDTTNPYALSVYAIVTTGSPGTLSYGASALATVPIPVGTSLQRIKLPLIIPDVTTRNLRITIPAGAVVYFILNQLEQFPFPTSVILVNGATATRATDLLFDAAIATRSYYNAANGAILVECDVDDATNTNANYNQYFFSLAYNNATTDRITNYIVGGRAAIKCGSSMSNNPVTLTYGPNNGQSATDLGSVDATNAVFHSAATWDFPNSKLVTVNGALDVNYEAIPNAYSSTPPNRLDIGGRQFASYICGHIRGLTIFNQTPSTPTLGTYMNFANTVGVASEGQSSLATCWSAAGTSGTDYGVGFNDGEKAWVNTIAQYYPGQRNLLLHMAVSGSDISVAGVNSWYDYSTNAPQILLTRALDILAAFRNGGGTLIGTLPNGHESDTGQTRAVLNQSYNYVMSRLLAVPISATNSSPLSSLPIIYQPIARRQDSASNNDPYQHMREFQHAYVTANNNWVLGTERFTQPMESNGVHTSDLGNQAQMPKDARLLASLNGKTVAGPVTGPTVSTATRTGTSIVVVMSEPSGITDFTPTSGIQGFTFYDQTTVPGVDAFPSGAIIAVTAAVRTNATTITLTLASTPTTTGLLYYGYGSGLVNGTATYVTPTSLVAGNDAFLMPLRATTMPLPYNSAPVTGFAHVQSAFSNGYS